MSNVLAIAAVTSTIRHVLHESLSWLPDPVGGSDVTTLRPAQLAADDGPGTDSAGLNVYLYQVTPNHAWNLSDLPTRSPAGTLTHRPVAAIDLHYLVTAYGDESALEPQRLLARSALALSVTPVLTKDVIEHAIDKYGSGSTAFLDHADLADQAELVKVSPTPLTLEEISKLWGVLGASYLLSQTYTATVVLLEAEVPVRSALPVRQRELDVRTFTQARLEQVVVDGSGPAVTGSTLQLLGAGLLGARTTLVTIGGRRLVPEAGSTGNQLVVALSDRVPAGAHRLQVAHVQPADPVSGEPERVTGRSNGVALTVVPRITNVTRPAGLVRIRVVPALHEGQRATVTFGRLTGGLPDDPGVVTVTFPPAPVLVEPADPADPVPPSTLDVVESALTAGTWLVRVGIDGAESIPSATGDEYDTPAVTVP